MRRLSRARLGDDVTDIDPDDVEKDELTILADALLNMDLAGGDQDLRRTDGERPGQLVVVPCLWTAGSLSTSKSSPRTDSRPRSAAG